MNRLFKKSYSGNGVFFTELCTEFFTVIAQSSLTSDMMYYHGN